MAYDYQPYYRPYQPPVNAIVSVTGIEGARAYQLPPNSSVPLFDADSDTLYVKTTDGAGFPTIRTFRFEEVKEQPITALAGDYVTRDELQGMFDELKVMIESAKQPVQQSRRKQLDADAQ